VAVQVHIERIEVCRGKYRQFRSRNVLAASIALVEAIILRVFLISSIVRWHERVG
jgi:hypothetical protein